MPWSKVEIGELLLLEKGHEMQQIVGVGRQRVGRTPPSTQVPQEASYNGNGLAVIIEQFKGFVMVIVLADMVDAHGSLAPSLASKHLFLSRTNAQQGYKCPHNSETPFEQRFQGLLRQAWKLRRWHVIVAEPGSGKTMGIRDLSAQASREVGGMGGRLYPVLAVTAPKNDPKEAALGNFLLTALGLGARGRWSERKYLLFELLLQYGVECLVIDDAHDLSMPHLIFLKELTDQLQLTHPPYALGFCLVSAGRGATIPLKDVFDQPETMWMQFRRRLDRLYPYCRVASHTEGEVRDILLALEHIYRPSFPALNLQQWTGSMYTWLTHPLLDPQKSGRVLMDHLMKLVTTALQWSYAKAEEDVSPEHLEAAADQLTLRRDKIHVVDAEQVKKEGESEKQESPEEPGESKPKEKKAEKRGKKKRSSEESEPPNPK